MSKSKSNKTCKDYFEIAYVYVIREWIRLYSEFVWSAQSWLVINNCLPFKFLNNSVIFNLTLAFINIIIVPLGHCVYKSRTRTTLSLCVRNKFIIIFSTRNWDKIHGTNNAYFCTLTNLSRCR